MDTDGPSLVQTGGALNIHYQGRLLYPERGPSSLALRLAQACEVGPSRLHLVFSPGLWYGVRELLDRLGEGSAVLCVEADPALARLSRERLPPELSTDPRLAFLASSDPSRMLEAACGLGRFRRCIPLRISGGATFHERSYAEAGASLQAEFAAFWRSKAALLSMGRLWTRNIFRNLARIEEIDPQPLPQFDRPAVICGAGPSLEDTLPFIVEERARLAVIAVDTALGSLVDAGIEPDLVVCLEGQAHNLPDFMPAASRHIALLADLSSHPSSFGALKGRHHLSGVRITPGPFMARLADLGLPSLPCPPLGSVGVHAVHVAKKLCAGVLFATGLDFSFERGKTHCRGAPGLRAELACMTRFRRWPGQQGAAFRPGVISLPGSDQLSDPILCAYAALLEDETCGEGSRFFDLRGRGMPIGAQALTFAEASAIVRRAPASKTGAQSLPRQGSIKEGPSAVAERAKAFISSERARLEAILDVLKGRSALPRDSLATLVLEADYLLWPLADDHRLSGMPQDLLNRILVEVEYWRWKLDDLVSGGGDSLKG